MAEDKVRAALEVARRALESIRDKSVEPGSAWCQACSTNGGHRGDVRCGIASRALTAIGAVTGGGAGTDQDGDDDDDGPVPCCNCGEVLTVETAGAHACPDFVAGGTPGAGEARCPVCEHTWTEHADDGSGCLRNCGADICPCKRPRDAALANPVAQRRPPPSHGDIRLALAPWIDNPWVLTRVVEEVVRFVEADRRGEP